MRWVSISRNTCWILAAVLVSVEIAVSLVVRHSYFMTAFGDITQCLVLLFASLAVFANARQAERRTKLFWALMTLGCGSWTLVQGLWTYFEVFERTDVPNPFVGDVALFLHLVPMMGALVIRPDLEQEKSIARLGGLDFTLLFTWWLYLYLFAVIPWQYVWPQDVLYGRSFNSLYFAEHAVFLFCAVTAWKGSTGIWRIMYGHLLGAGLLYCISSIAASEAIDKGTYYTGSLYDAPLLISMLWFSAVGFLGQREASQIRSHKPSARKRGIWVTGLGMVAILSLPVLAGWSIYISHAPSKVQNFRLLLTLATMMVMGALLWIKQQSLDTEIACSNQKLQEDSHTDLLTGAKNRRFFTATIEAEALRVMEGYSKSTSAQGQRNPDLVFYLIDCDYFKEVNDQYGHEAGDELLIEIARRISSAIRYSDVLIRWGGDEFLVLSRHTNRQEGDILAERVLHGIGGEPFTLKGGHQLRCTCSIGWTVFPWFVDEPEAVEHSEALRLADSSLYEAKKAGRNQAWGTLPASERSAPVVAVRMSGKEAGLVEQLSARTQVTKGPEPLTRYAAAPTHAT